MRSNRVWDRTRHASSGVLRLVGEGQYLSMIVAGRPMAALLHFAADPTPPCAPPDCLYTPSYHHEVQEIFLEANNLADYALYAPGMARSRIKAVVANQVATNSRVTQTPVSTLH